MDIIPTLEGIFKARGYNVLRSSEENRYMLIEKDGSRVAVGHSISCGELTEGEAVMFLSMGENDSAASMLFISPLKLRSSVRDLFENEGVETWDRVDISTAIGDLVLSEWGMMEAERGRDQVSELIGTRGNEGVDDVSPHREVGPREMGGFKVREVEMVGGEMKGKISPIAAGHRKGEAAPEPEEPSRDEGSGSEPLIEPSAPENEEGMPLPDLPGMVHDEVLLGSVRDADRLVSGQVVHPEPQESAVKRPSMEVPARTDNPWSGSTLAPLKYTERDALSLAGEVESVQLRRENRPFLLLEASYMMVPEDGTAPVEQDGTYLYDCLRSEVFDIPGSLYDEVAEIKERWDGSDGPDTLKKLRDDHNSAMASLKMKIGNEQMAKDRKVRETLMSAIYREINYSFDPDSLRLISSRRVMLPFWVKDGAEGKTEWEVNGYLGQHSK
ncbi:MAG: hypothetical protein JW939_05185 [Candidatus Thermoplasmatota archaeon]|nr:hypothetical protein [Candidatus Thermoplasmatota archaeon]